MDIHIFVLAWSVYTISTCLCVLRTKCQVLESKYLQSGLSLSFNMCGDFELLNYTIAVNCDKVENFNDSLAELPAETDWLCLTNCKDHKIAEGTFSQFRKLQALYITGNFELASGAFKGLSQLSVLWIGSKNISDVITFTKDAFDELHSLLELKLIRIPFSTMEISALDHLDDLRHLILEENDIRFLSTVTKSLSKQTALQKLSIINNNIEVLRAEDCIRSGYPMADGDVVDFNISALDLSLNKIKSIEKNSLCNFPFLSSFTADKTNITVEEIFRAGIKTIRTLVLSNNSIASIDLCRTASNLNVKELLLTQSALKVFNTSLGSCRNLTIVNMSGNDLQEVHFTETKQMEDLIDLDMSHNQISIFNICPTDPVIKTAMKLVYLRLSHNFLGIVGENQFQCLENLKVLALDHNKMYKLEDFAFRGLTRLKSLDLQHNNINNIRKLTFSDLFNVTHLNLFENKIHTVAKSSFGNLEHIQKLEITFRNYIDDIWTYIDGQFIKHIVVKSYDDNVYLHKDQIKRFSGLQTFDIESRYIFLDSCKEFVFTQLEKMRLRNNLHFICLPSGSQALEKFVHLEKLYYDANSQDSTDVTTLNSSLGNLQKLKFLQIANTDKLIGRAPIDLLNLFGGLSHLKVLHLKNSGLDNLDSATIFHDLTSVEFFLIENQNINSFSERVLALMPNLRYVYLKNVVFSCNCKFRGLSFWLKYETKVSIINFHAQICFMNNRNVNLLDFLHENCHDYSDFKIFISTFISTLLFMIISLFHDSILWHAMYLFYTVKCWLNHRMQGGESEQYKYDVFVSYNTSDERWIIEELLPNVEQKGPSFYRVCIHNRDFEIGRDIVENIVDSIYKSRWTICIITRSYLQSHWCSLEMRMATYRLIAESKDSLLLIFLDKISKDEIQCYHRLTKLLDKKTYLEWPEDSKGQDLFWVRLRKVLGTTNDEENLETKINCAQKVYVTC